MLSCIVTHFDSTNFRYASTIHSTDLCHIKTRFLPCTGPPYGNVPGPGAGGCPSGCYCDHDISGGGFCEGSGVCGNTCATDADCQAGTKCTDSYTGECGGLVCLDSASCVGQVSKRSLFAKGDAMWKHWQMMDTRAKRADKLPLHPPPT